MKNFLYAFLFLAVAVGLNAQTYKLPKGVTSADYMPGTIILKVKNDYRINCTETGINISALQKAFNTIGLTSIKKKFKNEQPPREKFNSEGHAYADLSLIYECKYSSQLPIEKVINLLLSTQALAYVEPHFIPKISYVPNDPLATLSGQYHLAQIDAYNAWNISKGDTNTVVAITDTGTDPNHPDLKDNIKHNYADPINGIDDDADGYVDNFSGWDVGDNDNNPVWPVGAAGAPQHGIHTCGIAGMTTDNNIGGAGVGFLCKFLPVKIADTTGALVGAYEGIKYAAEHGCKVINCSWGGPGGGQYGQDICTYATINKDALVIAAAGNNGSEIDFYPAAYEYVLAVANTNQSDQYESSSNYGYFIDVSAPGRDINSTWLSNGYSLQTGTSMSAPVVSGAAGIVRSYFSGYTALQAGERLKRTTDYIYSIPQNAPYQDKLGTGRIDLYKALTDPNTPSVVFSSINMYDKNDEFFNSGDTLHISGVFTNYLAATSALNATLVPLSSQAVPVMNTYSLGTINTLSSKTNSATPFEFVLTGTFVTNAKLIFRLDMQDGSYSASQFITVYVNVDYININVNDIASTATSKGKIGYNQDSQVQGLGFSYNNVNLMWDAGLMIGIDTAHVSDCVRGTGGGNDADFKVLIPVQHILAGAQSDFDAIAQFNDVVSTTTIGVQVDQFNYAWSTAPYRKFIVWEYVIRNTTTDTLKNLYAGICADWDIDATSFANNKSAYDSTSKMGYSWCTNAGGKFAGIKLLTNTGSPVFYAIDNVPGGGGGYDIQGGFTTPLKYKTLSTKRLTAGGSGTGNDILNVMSSGPHVINPGQSAKVAFALIAGDDLNDLISSANAAQVKYNSFVGIKEEVKAGNSVSLYPNPASQQVNVSIRNSEEHCITVYDMTGKLVYKTKTSASFIIPVSEWSRGIYLVKVENRSGVSHAKIVLE